MIHRDDELAEKCEYIDERCNDCPIAAYGCTACRDLF